MGNPTPYQTWEEKRELLRKLLDGRKQLDPGDLTLGEDEVRFPGTEGERVARFQQGFRWLASEMAPEFLGQLAGRPLAEYAAFLAEHHYRTDADLVNAPEFERFAMPEHRVPLADEFLRWVVARPDSATMGWARYWGLPARVDEDSLLSAFAPRPDRRLRPRADWGIVAAVCTVGRWRCRRIDAEEDLVLRHPDECEDPPLPEGDEFRDRTVPVGERVLELPQVSWLMLEESKAEAFSRIMDEYRAAVAIQLDAIAAEGPQSDERARRAKPKAWNHVVWLVRYQIRGESMADIAAGSGVKRDAVEKAIGEMAEMVGVDLRKSDRGRPRRRSRSVRIPHPCIGK